MTTKEIIRENFKNIHQLIEYIKNNPRNPVFANERFLASSEVDSYRTNFTKTKTFDEALHLLQYGWHEKAKELENRLKAKKINATNKSQKSIYDVVGHQASVPRYLQGIPTNMVNKKTIIKKQPVITIVKNIGYNSNVDSETIMEQSVKALQIIQTIENSGTRVNLDLIKYTSGIKQNMVTRIRIKNAGERLNISKMAFPLIHPSMLRRIMFAHVETCRELRDNSYSGGYGRSMNTHEELKSVVKNNEYVIPGFIENVDDTIKEMGLKTK